MRHYPRNSPQAAGRILALALLSDGHLSKRELDVLDRLDAHVRLGLGRTELHTVVHGFCEDLLSSMHLSWGDACQVDQATLRMIARLYDALHDPATQPILTMPTDTGTGTSSAPTVSGADSSCTTVLSFSLPAGVFGGKNSKLIGVLAAISSGRCRACTGRPRARRCRRPALRSAR